MYFENSTTKKTIKMVKMTNVHENLNFIIIYNIYILYNMIYQIQKTFSAYTKDVMDEVTRLIKSDDLKTSLG